MMLRKSRDAAGPNGSAVAEDTSEQPPRDPAVEHDADTGEPSVAAAPERRRNWSRVIARGVLPGLALLLTVAAGFLKWQDGSVRAEQAVGAEALRAATDGTIALLSYQPDTVEKDLEAGRERLTGDFLESYTALTHDVVIPGAKQKQIAAVATVPAGAPTAVTPGHAVVLLFVNQTVSVGDDPPTNTTSSVRVTVDKVGGRWLISQFDPV